MNARPDARDFASPQKFGIGQPVPRAEDPVLVRGALENLVDNAVSFSPPEGHVRVHLHAKDRMAVLKVEDEGPGIRDDAFEKIFERFYTDRPEQGFGQNSGLGLSISRQIVQAHRGTIRAENRLGPPGEDGEPTVLGARFIVRIPAQSR